METMSILQAARRVVGVVALVALSALGAGCDADDRAPARDYMSREEFDVLLTSPEFVDMMLAHAGIDDYDGGVQPYAVLKRSNEEVYVAFRNTLHAPLIGGGSLDEVSGRALILTADIGMLFAPFLSDEQTQVRLLHMNGFIERARAHEPYLCANPARVKLNELPVEVTGAVYTRPFIEDTWRLIDLGSGNKNLYNAGDYRVTFASYSLEQEIDAKMVARFNDDYAAALNAARGYGATPEQLDLACEANSWLFVELLGRDEAEAGGMARRAAATASRAMYGYGALD